MRRVSDRSRAKGGSTRKAARAPVRRRPRADWQIALLRWGGPVLGVVVLAAAGAWAFSSGWVDRQWAALSAATLEASADAGLALREVLVQGRSRTSQEELMAALGLKLGAPILAIDPAELRTRLEALPWVARATVERRLPDTLFISVEEREPLALWQHDGALVLIDREGTVIPDPAIERFAGLPLVVGDGANVRAAELVELLAEAPELASRVKAAVWVGGRRWNIRFDNNVDLRLPEENGAAAWKEFAAIERRHGLLDRDLTTIDLRQPDRFLVRLTPEAAARRRDPGDST